MKFYSTSHDYSGRKIKKPKPKGEVYAKFQPPAFRPIESKKSSGVLSYAEQRRRELAQYPSRDDFAIRGGEKSEPQKYTGDYVIGIATMHKSNAVPVTNPKHATEISEMAK
jgi:hypothetical protein